MLMARTFEVHVLCGVLRCLKIELWGIVHVKWLVLLILVLERCLIEFDWLE